ncbi:50S ribosomal protein L11 methyltransferase [Salipaludibacillus agaradhaerens]|uniref:Ribosomal protein L11 methyltransferase n=1 Tax=Salipaludibacillus agaradhaerens TaxID=76935 RepID=A0A9Q4FXM0_SALAG|nr:50S ribosomal protein L11 methyltransferase [Salipaludibacillus agaradhaerens]UJW57443.1 50S ribosomal protein L11 methyltransferase [Bacillus sp. A116_S68]MCR6096795.1 50S ribosomal protein L11 methyltransferase [Salipaludibacillus agaradhaerens]MCR6106302.1 50S ribosomal protein L11 methyltransferase [Salipaludibacillus agaradhaerens]MCR6113646.1 50S ribosomal protein L11 methyltransferase [Salipaludibacillus agaradhaerens]MCR6118335.1 50S ribosomal protein L11 methyltransferase [Salipalu
MKWSEICIHTTQEAVEPVSNILHEAGASGVVIEDPDDLFKERESVFGEVYELSSDDYPEEGVMLKAYLPVNSFLGEAVEEIKEAINQLLLYDIDLGHNKVTLSEVNEEEWSTAWKKYYKPVKVSDHITITPTWEDYQPVGEEEIVIELDPGMAFGTGTHPTTVLCIQALERHLYDGASVVDVGTGTGVLSIAAAKLGAAKVHALDLDEVAVKSAKLNVKLNKVQEIVDVTQDNLLDNQALQTPDLIVANILAEVIVNMTDEAFQSLKTGGTLITSGIIQTKRDMVKNALKSAGFVIKEITEMEDWLAFVAKKPE